MYSLSVNEKKKSKSKPKKEILQLYSSKDVVAKLCSASAHNDLIKEHNKIIEDCILEITNLYEDYRNNFLYRRQKIDFLIGEFNFYDARELLAKQNLELKEFSKRTREKQILKSFSIKHKLLKEKNRKLFEESGIFEFIRYFNQKYIGFLNDISEKALKFKSEILDRKLFLIKNQRALYSFLSMNFGEDIYQIIILLK